VACNSKARHPRWTLQPEFPMQWQAAGPVGTEQIKFMSKPESVEDDSDGDVERGSRKPNPIDAHVGTRVYEKGVNRIGASRLFDLARVLGVPIQFFYDEAPTEMSDPTPAPGFAERPAESYVVEFLSTREGLELNKAFVKIADPKVRRSVVDLVRSLSGETPSE